MVVLPCQPDELITVIGLLKVTIVYAICASLYSRSLSRFTVSEEFRPLSTSSNAPPLFAHSYQSDRNASFFSKSLSNPECLSLKAFK
jgi:hypothetical protein